MNCLYILDIKPLLVASFADIFAHSTDCSGVFVVASLGIGLHHRACRILTKDQTCASCSEVQSLNHWISTEFPGFFFLIASLAVQKILNLTRSYLFIFVFISAALRD